MSTESSSRKRRTRVAQKPKLGSAGLDLTSSLHSPFKSTYTSVPRVIRSRIAKATLPPKTKQKKTETAEPSNQPIARSNSGKVALGPWSGAFGQHQQENVSPDNPVLYIDRAGSTHKELDEGQRNGTEETMMAKGHRKGTILATSPAALMTIPPPDETTMKLHSREVATLQQKPIVAHWGRSACGKQACKGRATAKVGFINQPKRGL